MKVAAIVAWVIAFGLAGIGVGLDAGWTAHEFSAIGLILFLISIPSVGLIIGMLATDDDPPDAFTRKPGTDEE